jgi:hypothetical protein
MRETPSQYCLYAIHGPAFVATRGGNFWEPEDEPQGRVLFASGGLLIVSCETPEDSVQVRKLLDAQGLVAGVDYGMGSRGNEELPCGGILFKHGIGGNVQATGQGDWKAPPMPEHIQTRREAESEESQAAWYDLFRETASMMGVDRLRLESIDRNPKASARNRSLMFALRSKGEGRG